MQGVVGKMMKGFKRLFHPSLFKGEKIVGVEDVLHVLDMQSKREVIRGSVRGKRPGREKFGYTPLGW